MGFNKIQWGCSRDAAGTQWGCNGDSVGMQWGVNGDLVGMPWSIRLVDMLIEDGLGDGDG